MDYSFVHFECASGQLVVQFGNSRLCIDVPIENGAFLTGEALHHYVRGFIPHIDHERAAALSTAPLGAEQILAQCTEGEFALPAPTYAELRQNAYPAITDYLDAVVKDDAEALQAYIERCREVKAMFPKPYNDVSAEVLRQRRDL